MKTTYYLRCIVLSLIVIFCIPNFYGQDGAWPGLDLGTISCGTTNSPSGSTSGADISCVVSSAGDHIYQFTIALDADVTIDVCGASWDTELHLFNLTNGDCDGGAIASNDDFCGAQSSIIQNGLAAGTYVVVVEGYSASEGAYTLNIDVANCVNPDIPCGASNLVLCTTPTSGDNTGMTDSGVSSPSCGNYTGGDLWYKATVPTSGELQVEAMANSINDLAMALYTVSGGCSGTFTQVACDANSGEGNMPMINQTGLTGGSEVYIRVWVENNDQTGTFQVEARDMSDLFCYTGNATSLGSGCAQLTGAVNNQNGAIWDSNDQLNFSQDFSYDFTVNLGSDDSGADGLAFVMHNDSRGLATTGTAGGALGAGGIDNSLIVEIDTYINTEDRDDGITGIVCSGGPEPDHLDIWTNGNINPFADCSFSGPGARVIPNGERLELSGSAYNIENGLDHILRVSYIASSETFTAEILNAAGTTSYGSVSYTPVDPLTLFGTYAPYFGFTASTGGLNNQQSGCLPPEFAVPLPIYLANFDAACNNGYTTLNWSTGTEINNDFFEIEKSTDGIDYELVDVVPSYGNSNEYQYYQWTNDQVENGVAYYRLKQTDFDGQVEYFEPVACNCKESFEIGIFPNPTTTDFTIEVPKNVSFPIVVEVNDYTGRLIKRKDVVEPLSKIKIEDLAQGSYLIKVTNKEFQLVEKVFKLR